MHWSGKGLPVANGNEYLSVCHFGSFKSKVANVYLFLAHRIIIFVLEVTGCRRSEGYERSSTQIFTSICHANVFIVARMIAE